MMMRLRPIVLLAAAAASAAGCTFHAGTARPATYGELRQEGGWILIDSVPFVAQSSEEDCGAACLSMVLAHWGVEVPSAELERECAVDGVEGLPAASLRDAARKRGLNAFLFAGGVEDLEHELRRGRPVVVGLVKVLGPLAAAHYEVVVGLQPETRRVAALDPGRGLVSDDLPAFAEEWGATKGVTLVMFRPAAEAVSRRPAKPSMGGAR